MKLKQKSALQSVELHTSIIILRTTEEKPPQVNDICGFREPKEPTPLQEEGEIKKKKKQPPAARHPLRFEVHLSHETQPRLTSKRELQWLNACQP